MTATRKKARHGELNEMTLRRAALQTVTGQRQQLEANTVLECDETLNLVFLSGSATDSMLARH